MMQDYTMTRDEFDKIARFIYDQVGIHMAEHKINLVKGRLAKRLRFFGFNTFMQYYDYLVHDKSGEELLMFINEISTNVTSFFREPSQWEYLEQELKRINQSGGTSRLRIWSAACSSGQEPYTIAMFLLHNLKDAASWDIKILATDISEEILTKAAAGIYSEEDVKGLPKNMLSMYFTRQKSKGGLSFAIKEPIKKMVTFRKFNLARDVYSVIRSQTFDWVFCRNVMIYFDTETKNSVVLNLVDKLKRHGHLLIGHSESLVSMRQSRVRLQAPSIYKKL